MASAKQCETRIAVLGNRLEQDEIQQLQRRKGIVEVPIGIHDLESGYQGPTSMFLSGAVATRWKVLQGKIFRMSVPFSDTAQHTWYQLIKKRSHFEFELLRELNAVPLSLHSD